MDIKEEIDILKERINQLEENQLGLTKEITELQKKVENEHFYDLRL